MSKKAELPLSAHHILLFDEDWAFLEDQFGKHSSNRIGAGVAVRRVVHRACQLIKQQAAEAADKRYSTEMKAMAGMMERVETSE